MKRRDGKDNAMTETALGVCLFSVLFSCHFICILNNTATLNQYVLHPRNYCSKLFLLHAQPIKCLNTLQYTAYFFNPGKEQHICRTEIWANCLCVQFFTIKWHSDTAHSGKRATVKSLLPPLSKNIPHIHVA